MSPSSTSKRSRAKRQQELLERIERARTLLEGADRVLVGAGAGLSAAAGLRYDGERFHRGFAPFIERYGMTDMYSAGFYPFPSEEDRWAYWARHVWANRYEPPALPLYRCLLEAIHGKEWFVLTTNVDAQFEKAGFDPARIFAVQGDYGFQPVRARLPRQPLPESRARRGHPRGGGRRRPDAGTERSRSALPRVRRAHGSAPAHRRCIRRKRRLA